MIATGKSKGGSKIVDQSKAFPLARTTTLDSKVGATLMMMMGGNSRFNQDNGTPEICFDITISSSTMVDRVVVPSAQSR